MTEIFLMRKLRTLGVPKLFEICELSSIKADLVCRMMGGSSKSYKFSLFDSDISFEL